jgi:hypothetical protein
MQKAKTRKPATPSVNALQRAQKDASAIVPPGSCDPKSISDGIKMESFRGKSRGTVAA